MIDKLKALEIIDKRDFFNDRAGRELWSKKPIDIQNEDIKNAHKDYKLLREYILGQPKVNEWIPVEERLPKDLESVLVSCDNGEVDYGFYSDDHFFLDYIDDEAYPVIAWMPLPEPYKGSDEDVD